MKKILSAVFLLISIGCFSQEDRADIRDISRINIVSPGLSYEKRIARLQSLYAQAYLSLNASFNISDANGTEFDLFVDPSLILHYRYYYNGDKRFEAGKRIDMNSLNYIAPLFETTFSRKRLSTNHFVEDKRRFINRVGLLWGFQRNYENRLSIDLNAGLSLLHTKSTMPDDFGQVVNINVNQFSPLLKLTFGFWLNRKPE